MIIFPCSKRWKFNDAHSGDFLVKKLFDVKSLKENSRNHNLGQGVTMENKIIQNND